MSCNLCWAHTLRACFAIAIVSAVQAAPSAASEPLPVSDTLVVTATRSPQHPIDVPMGIEVIDRSEIDRSGATQVVELLDGVAGVQVYDLYGDGRSATIATRGFGSTGSMNTLLLIDGRRVNNSLDIGSPTLAGVSVEEIERIEILPASAGGLYGEGAVGGVINIITRPVGDAGVFIEATGGSRSFERYTASLSTGMQAGSGFRVFTEQRRGDGYRDHSAMERSLAKVTAGREWSGARGFATFSLLEEYSQLAGALFAEEVAQDRKSARNHTDFLDAKRELVRLVSEFDLPLNWSLNSELSWRRDRVDGAIEFGGMPSLTDQFREQVLFTPRLVGQSPSVHGPTLWTFGVDLESGEYAFSSVLGTQVAEQDHAGLYAQVIHPLARAWTLTLSTRAGTQDLWLQDGFTFPSGERQTDTLWGGGAALAYQVLPTTIWYLRLDRNHRFARVDEHSGQPFNPLGVYRPLDAQQGLSWETGIDWAAGPQVAHLDLYLLDLTDEIAYDSTQFANLNLDATQRVGLNARWDWRHNRALQLGLRYSHLHARFETGPHDGNRIPLTPRHQAAAVVSGAVWSFDYFAEWRWYDEQRVSADFANQFPALDGYQTLNLTLGWAAGDWAVKARVINALDEHYSGFAAVAYNPATFSNDVGYYPAPERTYEVRLQWRMR